MNTLEHVKAINEDARHCSFSLELYSTLGTTQLGDSSSIGEIVNCKTARHYCNSVATESMSTDGLASSRGQ